MGTQQGTLRQVPSDEIAWKKFRYCPAIGGVSRWEWTERGYHDGTCFSVVGSLKIPKGSTVLSVDNKVLKTNMASLIEGSLEQVGGKKVNRPLTDDHGIVSSIFDRTFYYPSGKLVKPEYTFNASSVGGSGLYAYRQHKNALAHVGDYINRRDEP